MATSGVTGNLKVAYSLLSPVSWQEIPQVLDCTVPTFGREKIDTTVHGTTLYKRSMPGFNQVGDMTMKLLADLDELTTPTHAALQDLNVAGTTVWWRIEVAVNREANRWKAWEFQGYVGDFKPVIPPGGRSEIDVTVPFDGTSFTVYPAGASQI